MVRMSCVYGVRIQVERSIDVRTDASVLTAHGRARQASALRHVRQTGRVDSLSAKGGEGKQRQQRGTSAGRTKTGPSRGRLASGAATSSGAALLGSSRQSKQIGAEEREDKAPPDGPRTTGGDEAMKSGLFIMSSSKQ